MKNILKLFKGFRNEKFLPNKNQQDDFNQPTDGTEFSKRLDQMMKKFLKTGKFMKTIKDGNLLKLIYFILSGYKNAISNSYT